MVETNSAYKLGRVIFSLSNCRSELAADVDLLLPRYLSGPDSAEIIDLVSIDATELHGIKEVINVVLRKHEGVLWIDAGCLLSPSGKRFLIVGKSSAGKSTLTMAMALGSGWRVITEDLILIDLDADTLITFATPFSFKEGTLKLVEETVKKDITQYLIGEWLPLGDLVAPGEQSAHFDFSIVLTERDETKPFELLESSSVKLLPEIIKCSNTLRVANGMDQMLSYLSEGKCFSGRFGSLRQRIDALVTLEKGSI